MKFQNRRRHDSVKSCICSSLLVLVICGAFIFFLDPWNIPIKRAERVGFKDNNEQLKPELEVPVKNEGVVYTYNNTAQKIFPSSDQGDVKSDSDEYIEIPTYEKIRQAPSNYNNTINNHSSKLELESTTEGDKWMIDQTQQKDITTIDAMASSEEVTSATMESSNGRTFPTSTENEQITTVNYEDQYLVF